MTKAQLNLLRAIFVYQYKNGGLCPSFQDICDLTGRKTKSGIGKTAISLRDRGYIYYEPGMKRSLQITEAGEAYLNKWE